MGGEQMRHGVASRMLRRQIVKGAGNMAVALHRPEGRQHREGIAQALAAGIEPDVRRHAAGQARKLQRQELVQIDGFQQPVVEGLQHFRRNQGNAKSDHSLPEMVDAAHGARLRTSAKP